LLPAQETLSVWLCGVGRMARLKDVTTDAGDFIGFPLDE
jgi:hypothetical protein